jgi:hypothetical protein
VGQVAGMKLPSPIRQLAQAGEAVDHRLGCGGQTGGNLGGLGSSLGRGPARKQQAGKAGETGKTNETQLQY